MKRLIAILLALGQITPVAFAKGKIQNEDVKSSAEIIAAGGTNAQLINDTKIWMTTTSPAQQLSAAITSGAIGGGGGGEGVNYLSNASFEGGVGSPWVTTTAASSVDASNYTDGLQSALLTFSSSAGNIAQTNSSYTTQLAGTNLQASCWVKTSLSTIQVCGLVGGAETNCVNVASNNQWAQYNSIFTLSSNGTSIGLDVKTSSSTTGTVSIDQCYVGKATVLGTGYIATDWTAYTPTLVGVGTASAVNVYYRRVGDNLQAQGVFQTGTTTGVTFSASLPSGLSIDTAKVTSSTVQVGTIQGVQTSASNTQIPNVSFGPWAVIASTGVSTSNVYASGHIQNNAFNTEVGTAFLNSQLVSFSFSVPILGWTSSQSAYRADSTPASWSGYHDSNCSWTRTNTAYGSFGQGGASCALHERYNRNFGSVTSELSTGQDSPGIVFTPPRSGRYLVTAVFPANAGTTGQSMNWRLWDGTNQLANATYNNTPTAALTLSGIFNSTGASVTIDIQGKATSNSLSIAGSDDLVDWTIVELDAPMPSPYLTGSVQNSGTGVIRSDYYMIANNGTASVSSASDSGTTASRTSIGLTVVTFGHAYSANPACTCSVVDAAQQNRFCSINAALSTSGITISTNVANTGASIDENYNLVCLGNK